MTDRQSREPLPLSLFLPLVVKGLQLCPKLLSPPPDGLSLFTVYDGINLMKKQYGFNPTIMNLGYAMISPVADFCVPPASVREIKVSMGL